MTSTAPLAFILQDDISGKFRPEPMTWDAAQAAAKADGFCTVRRLDEVLAETGRA